MDMGVVRRGKHRDGGTAQKEVGCGDPPHSSDCHIMASGRHNIS